MSALQTPLLTEPVHTQLRAAQKAGGAQIECSLDLGRTQTQIEVSASDWIWQEKSYPFLDRCKERTIYYWNGTEFAVASRFTNSLIKLVPTEWGAPTFEIDGIKMLPTAQVSPFEDAKQKVTFIEPRGKAILDCCGGLGYFAAWCIALGAGRVQSFEKNPDVLWLRTLNPWSPENNIPAPNAIPVNALTVTNASIEAVIASLPDASFDAALHDPPRFGIAGELYSLVFYQQLARVLKPNALLFHYTGSPNKLTTGRDVPNEVSKRLQQAGFKTELRGDGMLARKK